MHANSPKTFESWAESWLQLARYPRPHLTDADRRIDAVSALWQQPIPSGWERDDDPALLDVTRRYRRSHPGRPDGPVSEALIEQQVLAPSPAHAATVCLNGRLVDGVNAVSLQRSAARSRRAGNV